MYRIERTDEDAQYVVYCEDKSRALSIFMSKLEMLTSGNYCHFLAEKQEKFTIDR